jgi:type I pantothenate kinase
MTEPETDLPMPYRVFDRAGWASLRADTPMTLTAQEIAALTSFNDRISMEEVETIYLPLSRLLWLYVAATQQLFSATARFLGDDGISKVPYVIGLAGSVSVGKSTVARILRELLARWPTTPKVDLVTTDGFLHPNAALQSQGLMERKGFPESYDGKTILSFLADIKAGKRNVSAPLYSHLVYDVLPDKRQIIDRPDILIVEGLNVLQPNRPPREGRSMPPFVSDYFDFSIYVDADERLIHDWYVERFMRLRQTAFLDPASFFHRYASLSDIEAVRYADGLWYRINLPNLRENIQPTRDRASLILTKGSDHRIEKVALRKL